MLEIVDLYAGYVKADTAHILKGVNLSIKAGDAVGVLGRNGSGKSTLAKAICGIVPYITKGEILYKDKSLVGIPVHKRTEMGIGFFQQGGIVFPNLTANENLIISSRNMSKVETQKRQLELSKSFELLRKPDRLKMKATFLSGGEKHQLALAMVIFKNPELLILDEPSAGLSPVNQKAMYAILESIRRSEKTTMLIIEQNVELAKGFCDKTIILNNGNFENNLVNNN